MGSGTEDVTRESVPPRLRAEVTSYLAWPLAYLTNTGPPVTTH